MFFVGGGSLVSQAVGYALSTGLHVDAVYCPIGDSAVPRLRRDKVVFVETADPNGELLQAIERHDEPNVFSINNGVMLSDRLLSSRANFFNIHNGLVQRYRGIAEVCIFAALCAGEHEYGVTMHRLLPGQKVDSGPVVDQISFPINVADHGFAQVMSNSLRCCQSIFEKNVVPVADKQYKEGYVEVAERAHSYQNLADIAKSADAEKLRKACQLGAYRAFFPRLADTVDAFQRDP